MHVFVYGTLMDDEIGGRMGLGRYGKVQAALHGFRRKMVRGEVYPGLIEDKDGAVAGLLYLDVADDDVNRLDCFEGEEYERIRVTAHLENGSPLTCETYLFREEFRHRLMDEEWDPKTFREEGRNRFIEDYKGWGDAR